MADWPRHHVRRMLLASHRTCVFHRASLFHVGFAQRHRQARSLWMPFRSTDHKEGLQCSDATNRKRFAGVVTANRSLNNRVQPFWKIARTTVQVRKCSDRSAGAKSRLRIAWEARINIELVLRKFHGGAGQHPTRSEGGGVGKPAANVTPL